MQNKKVKIVGIGQGSINIFKTIKEKEIDYYELISIGSDENVMELSLADKKLIIGDDGIGAGGNPAKGKVWAELAKDQIKELINNTETLILYSCLGGGTGSGALPVVARIAKEMGINTHVIVTVPFNFEGRKRINQAIYSIADIMQYFTDITIISNDDLLTTNDKHMTLREAFKVVDEIIIKKIDEIT